MADRKPAELYIATPSHDMMVHTTYCFSVVNLVLRPPCKFAIPTATYDGDIVRVRSRYVADFLQHPTATHLLFIDSDISFSSHAVAGMIAAGEDFVCCPYRKKRAETLYAINRLPGEPGQDYVVDPDRALIQIAGAGLGLALLSRACLDRMVREYGPTLTFSDEYRPGEKRPTVALFQLAMVPEDDEGEIYTGAERVDRTKNPSELFSEDHSFARRWLKLGGKVWLYLGPGSPVSHYGSFGFHGSPVDFGIRVNDP